MEGIIETAGTHSQEKISKKPKKIENIFMASTMGCIVQTASTHS